MMALPYIPKTTKHVQPGDFWAIKLDDGRYSAGRVLQILDRVTVLGCVLDWSSDGPPTEQAIAGAAVLATGRMHLKTIADCGDGIRGNRSLAEDNIELPLFRSHSEGPGQRLLEGATDIGPIDDDGTSLPVISTWGFGVAKLRANRRFCRRT
jgi:hypothetical protein